MSERDGDRPTRHGMILGEALAEIATAGLRATGTDIEPCATCAFRRGTVPNMTAGTGMVALNTFLDIDTDDFACHHGMRDGQPTRVCAGYLLARQAPWAEVKATFAAMKGRLDAMEGPDEVRAAYDAWLEATDPERRMDVYQLARAFARSGMDKGE